MQDRRLEEAQRIARQDVRDPRHDPRVELGVVIIEPRKVRRVAGERPRVQDRHPNEEG